MKARLAAPLLLLAAAPLAAQDAPPPPPPGAMTQMLERRFAAMDGNHDGAVTRAEFDTYRAQMRAARGQRDGADGPPPPPPAGGAGDDRAGGAAGDNSGGAGASPPGARRGVRGGGMGGQWFERADANGDGRVTLVEAQAAMQAMMAERRGGSGRDTPPPPAPR